MFEGNVRKLTVAILFGVCLIGGCSHGHVDTTDNTNKATQKVECNYQHGDFGSYTASNPIELVQGKQFGFNGSAHFDSKRLDTENKKVYGLVIKNGVCLYEVDVNNAPNGWNTLENQNNVYVADEVIRERMLIGDLVDQGIYPIEKVDNINDLLKFVDVTIVKAHIVHIHTKDCK